MPSEQRCRVIIGVAALVIVQAAAIGVYLAVEHKRNTETHTSFRVEQLSGGRAAPNILLERSDGTRLSLHDIDGRVRLVHFWATWCLPCVDELPGLLETSRALAAPGLVLVAISMDDDWTVIRTFFDGKIPAEIYRAVESDAHEQYDVFSLPDTYQIAQDGRLMLRYGGARDWKSRAALRHLGQQLRGGDPYTERD